MIETQTFLHSESPDDVSEYVTPRMILQAMRRNLVTKARVAMS